jgi:hypothetical protein
MNIWGNIYIYIIIIIYNMFIDSFFLLLFFSGMFEFQRIQQDPVYYF